MSDIPSAKHVSLVATPDIIVGTLAGLHDVFDCFGVLGWFDESLRRHPPFTVDIVASGNGPVSLNGGLTLPRVRPLDDVEHTDMVIMPSIMVADGNWQTGRHPELVDWLIAMHEEGAELCSACSGTLLMAETGLLDGRTATMHWAYADTFRRNFPAVTLRLEKALIIEGERHELVMSGASSSWHDLALYLIARHLGTAAAQAVAKFFAFDLHTDGMAAYAVFTPPFDHGDAVIARAQRWIAQHLDCHSPVEKMAEYCETSERSFKRRFTKATGYTPIQYVQALRLNEAKRLLERTPHPIDEIAWEVGYEDPAFFRRLFKRQVGITPGAHRRKFNVPGSEQSH
ncbi:AraC family transcriptional regulator [Litchfieldella qijiaojingensis]|uniref:AraC family transcriptional regulator n=1 Tax=Litchfieldella qijiaojingensis TaxID=980347 RepID=A0ABQ2YRK7_9GAMM|nr:helix-turn-helix domain-containing protein [Halomonas qijiaojingensis]GGX92005.1 AraC family transcriptional regulator [Halomonas qijiaojingensis]